MKNLKLFLVLLVIPIITNNAVFAQLQMDASGRIGIGNAPTTAYQLYIDAYHGKSYLYNLKSFDFESKYIQTSYINNYTSGVIEFWGYYGSTPALGIGKSPTGSYKLDINGDALCNTIWATSDKRFKKNIKSLDSKTITEKLKLIEAFQYEFKTDPELLSLHNSGVVNFQIDTFLINGEEGKKIKKTKISTPNLPKGNNFGLLAQDVQKVFPEFVKQDSVDGTYAINYTGFIPILLESTKAQQIQIETLQHTVTAQEVAIVELQKQVDKLAEKSKEKAATLEETTQASLMQNSPNPFTESTLINYYLPESTGTATIIIYDLNGTQLKGIALHQKGSGSITINGGDFSAGMYIYALIADGVVIDSKRMVLTE